MNVLYLYFFIILFRVMIPPTNLTELISLTELRKKLVLEYDNKANEFTLISDNVKVLGNINRKTRLNVK